MAASAGSCLVVWMTLFPLAEAWHLRAAVHGHRHCPTHNQIEEVPPGDSIGHPSYDHALPALRVTPPRNEHAACLLLNVDTPRNRHVTRPDASSVAAAPRPATAAVPTDPRADSRLLILTAPKNSPPPSAL
jgi:hypothetical protein